jgi:hypothetical protein
MRTLRFNVSKQRITNQKDCDFSGIVAGSVGYLYAKFDFSKEWDECTMKIARFWNNDNEYSVILDPNNECEIPHEALTNKIFRVSVLGVASQFRIDTNKAKVRQEVN